VRTVEKSVRVESWGVVVRLLSFTYRETAEDVVQSTMHNLFTRLARSATDLSLGGEGAKN
jgi:hypothetical protein